MKTAKQYFLEECRVDTPNDIYTLHYSELFEWMEEYKEYVLQQHSRPTKEEIDSILEDELWDVSQSIKNEIDIEVPFSTLCSHNDRICDEILSLMPENVTNKEMPDKIKTYCSLCGVRNDLHGTCCGEGNAKHIVNPDDKIINANGKGG